MTIQEIIKTQGWEEIKEMLERTTKEKKVNVNKTVEEIGQEYLALEKAEEIISEAIAKVERAGDEKEYKEQIYE